MDGHFHGLYSRYPILWLLCLSIEPLLDPFVHQSSPESTTPCPLVHFLHTLFSPRRHYLRNDALIPPSVAEALNKLQFIDSKNTECNFFENSIDSIEL